MTTSLALVQALLIIGIPLGIWLLPVVRKMIPLVVLQIVRGFVLGSSLPGIIALWSLEIPTFSESSLFLDGIAFYGVLLFVFVTGTHLDGSHFVIKSDRSSHKTRRVLFTRDSTPPLRMACTDRMVDNHASTPQILC